MDFMFSLSSFVCVTSFQAQGHSDRENMTGIWPVFGVDESRHLFADTPPDAARKTAEIKGISSTMPKFLGVW
jgi:hypothetical protein